MPGSSLQTPAFNLSVLATELTPLREKIASAIRAAIIDGRIGAGERLREPVLSRQLGVSRTPLREALLQLDSEGFVEMTPRRGAVVRPLSRQDAAETYEVKGALEALAARLACARMESATLQRLKEINDTIGSLGRARTAEQARILQLNAEFHQTLTDASGNEKLSQYVRVLRAQALRYNYIYLSVISRLEESVAEHNQILDALRRRKADEVERLVRDHGASASKALCSYIEQQPATITRRRQRSAS
jgi:DNA-binding GntR family transcriptional regulator